MPAKTEFVLVRVLVIVIGFRPPAALNSERPDGDKLYRTPSTVMVILGRTSRMTLLVRLRVRARARAREASFRQPDCLLYADR
jgi:hypothetical protein